MARTKEFDPDEVLDAAVDLFWRRGYEATSTADLVAHLGIARASLYGTFGSKHELYVRAMDRYVRQRNEEILAELAQPGDVLPVVRAFMLRWARRSMADTERRGCLVINATTELPPGDTEVERLIHCGWDTIDTALTSALLRARAQGELAADADPVALAQYLLVFLQGLRVLGQGGFAADRLELAVHQALRVLD